MEEVKKTFSKIFIKVQSFELLLPSNLYDCDSVALKISVSLNI